jgi:cbb3-type cytochrome oxidase maturation protein
MWALRNGQYDDEDTPAKRMLFDDVPVKKITTNNK